MRREKRWRYYCEFCKKSGASGGHMARHERGCTLNPDRLCGMCKLVREVQRPMAELLKLFADGGVPALAEATESCPTCILAALRQSGAEPDFGAFNFKQAAKTFWELYNDSEYA